MKTSSASMNFIDLNAQEYPAEALLVQQVGRDVDLSQAEIQKLTDLVDKMSISVQEIGERACTLVPFEALPLIFSDQNLSDTLGLSDDQVEKITDADRVKFGKTLLAKIDQLFDADLHPGLFILGLKSLGSQVLLAYSITGYSFSGIESSVIGYGKTEDDLRKRLQSNYLWVEDFFSVYSVHNFSEDPQVTDKLILENWSRF